MYLYQTTKWSWSGSWSKLFQSASSLVNDTMLRPARLTNRCQAVGVVSSRWLQDNHCLLLDKGGACIDWTRDHFYRTIKQVATKCKTECCGCLQSGFESATWECWDPKCHCWNTTVTLMPNPRSIYDLWNAYTHGVGGRKPARFSLHNRPRAGEGQTWTTISMTLNKVWQRYKSELAKA
jgi:hypothetical protein